MKKKHIIKQLELLKGIEPRESWADSARSLLLSQITAQEESGVTHQNSNVSFERSFAAVQDGFVVVERLLVRAFFSRRVASVVTLGLLVAGTAAASIFSQNSLPGDPLYAVKKTQEHMRLAVAPQEERPSLEFELVGERLKELEKITSEQGTEDQKSQKAKELVQNVSERVARVSDGLTTIKDSSKSQKIASVTNLVTERAKKLESSLQNLGNNIKTSDPVKQEAFVALEKVQEARNKALEVLVDRKNDVGEQQVNEQLAQQVKDVEKTLGDLHARITIASQDRFEPKEVIEKSKEAKGVLSRAREALEHNDFKLALEQLNQSRELAQEASKALQDSLRKGDANVRVQSEDSQGLK